MTGFFIRDPFAPTDYHERLWRLAESPASSLDLEEAKRWMHKSEDLAIDVARTNQSLFESVGLARASFPATDELDRLSERVYRIGTPTVAAAPPQSDRAALDAWKVKAVSELQAFVTQEYSEPIDSSRIPQAAHDGSGPPLTRPPNQALHRTRNQLRGFCAGEIGRYASGES